MIPVQKKMIYNIASSRMGIGNNQTEKRLQSEEIMKTSQLKGLEQEHIKFAKGNPNRNQSSKPNQPKTMNVKIVEDRYILSNFIYMDLFLYVPSCKLNTSLKTNNNEPI